MDPLLAARGFLGMVWYHFQIQELFGGKRANFDPHHVSETLGDVWLRGMERDLRLQIADCRLQVANLMVQQ